MRMRGLVVVVAAAGLLAVGCGPQKPEGSATPSSSAEASSTSAPSTKSSGFQEFTPATEPCSLVAPDQLNAQGTAPIKPDPMAPSNGIQECSYEEAGGHEVLNLSLFKNPDGASNFRSIHIRVLKSEGAEIYVMKDEPNECGAGIVNAEDNVVQFEFKPSAAAVTAAALPAEQTWCDFSAPVIAAVNKKLGWAK